MKNCRLTKYTTEEIDIYDEFLLSGINLEPLVEEFVPADDKEFEGYEGVDFKLPTMNIWEIRHPGGDGGFELKTADESVFNIFIRQQPPTDKYDKEFMGSYRWRKAMKQKRNLN